MEYTHQLAIDVVDGRFDRCGAVDRPASRHTLLSRAYGEGSFPFFSASTPLPHTHGAVIQLGLEPRQTTRADADAITSARSARVDVAVPRGDASSTDTGAMVGSGSIEDASSQPLVFRHLATRGWYSRGHREPFGPPAQEWIGVEVGNLHLARSQQRSQWRTQTYLVRSSGGAEQVLDTSLFVRVPLTPPATAAPDDTSARPVSSASTPSSLTFQSSLLANLAPSTSAAAPDLFGPKANLLVGGLEVGIDTHTPKKRDPLRVKAFVDTDGFVVGGSVWRQWNRLGATSSPRAPPTPAPSAQPSLAQSILSEIWPLPLRLEAGPTSSGIELSYVQELRDYSATLGVSQQFRWVDPAAAAAAPSPTPLPPCTLAATMQFYGHIMASLHAPLTRRLTLASSFHAQLTNGETRLTAGATYRLNEGQQAAASIDSRGGVRLGWQSRVRAVREDAGPLSRLLSRVRVAAHVQAFPLHPALVPKWNGDLTDLAGTIFSAKNNARMRQTQISCGIALEYSSE